MTSRPRFFLKAGAVAWAVFATSQWSAAQSVSGTSGDWVFASDDSVAEASVIKPDGTMFGLVCSGNCFNFLSVNEACREGANYSGTLRSTIGQFPVEMTCRHVDGRFVLTMVPGEDFVRITAESGELGIVVPFEEGDEKSYLFSLRGAYRAIYLTLANATLNTSAAQDEAEIPD